jgi:hypothetical protein
LPFFVECVVVPIRKFALGIQAGQRGSFVMQAFESCPEFR